ncbi:MAG: hypothetical protein H7343_04910 [Undibacterium sp.]|nr:hypothetical protein [Opitutaceae bacterium]
MNPDQIEFPPPAAPGPSTGPAWDEAFLRVESYLRAHHLEGRVRLNRLVTEIIREAHAWVDADPEVEPVVAAMHTTHARIGVWFARAGSADDWSDERARVRGRLALVLADLPRHGAHSFLSEDTALPSFAAALATDGFQPGPELRFSNMPPASLEFGFDEPGDVIAVKQRGWPVVRAAAVWLSIIGFLSVAWAASH